MVIRFATDHSAAKSGMQDLAASVVSSMVKVSGALGTGIEANGGLAASFKTLSANVANDVSKVASAGVEAAKASNYSAVATAAAVTRAAGETQTGMFAARASTAIATEGIRTNLGILKNEAVGTLGVLTSSPTFTGLVGAAAVVGTLAVAFQVMAATAKAASEALEEVARVGDQAAKLNVSTTFFQTYTAQARGLRVEVDDLVKSLDMAKQAFTVRLGGGADGANDSAFGARLRQHAKVGNVSDDQVASFAGAQGTEAQFRVALDLIAELQSKGRDLAALDLASKIFPPAIVERIRSGGIEIDRLRKTIDDIRNPDLVFLKPEEIVRAQELERRLKDAQAILDRAAKEFNAEMARAGMGYKEDAIAWKELMAGGARLAVSILKAGRSYLEQHNDTRPAVYGVDYFRAEDAPASGLARDLGKPKGPTATTDPEMDAARNALRANLGNRTLIDQAQSASNSMTHRFFPKDPSKDPDKATPKSRSESFDAVESFINGLERTAAATKAEAEAFGKSNAEKAEAIALAKLKETADQQGITVTEEQIAKVKAAATATAEYKDKLADLEQAQQQAAEASRAFGNTIASSLADSIENGKSLAEVFKNIQSMLLRGSLQALLTGQGPLAGILGMAPAASSGSNSVGGLAGLVSGMFRANGGPVQAGRAYTVGEMGQEIFVPNADGRMVPIARGGAGMMGAGGAPINVYNYAGGDVQARPERRSDGGTDFIIERLDSALADRWGRGQGDLSSISPGARRLRG